MASMVATLSVTGVAIGCAMCGEKAVRLGETATREAGEWARPHVWPRLIAVRASINGQDIGWSFK